MFYKNTILVVFLWVWAFFYEGHGFYFTIIISTDCNTYYKKEYKMKSVLEDYPRA